MKSLKSKILLSTAILSLAAPFTTNVFAEEVSQPSTSVVTNQKTTNVWLVKSTGELVIVDGKQAVKSIPFTKSLSEEQSNEIFKSFNIQSPMKKLTTLSYSKSIETENNQSLQAAAHYIVVGEDYSEYNDSKKDALNNQLQSAIDRELNDMQSYGKNLIQLIIVDANGNILTDSNGNQIIKYGSKADSDEAVGELMSQINSENLIPSGYQILAPSYSDELVVNTKDGNKTVKTYISIAIQSSDQITKELAEKVKVLLSTQNEAFAEKVKNIEDVKSLLENKVESNTQTPSEDNKSASTDTSSSAEDNKSDSTDTTSSSEDNKSDSTDTTSSSENTKSDSTDTTSSEDNKSASTEDEQLLQDKKNLEKTQFAETNVKNQTTVVAIIAMIASITGLVYINRRVKNKK